MASSEFFYLFFPKSTEHLGASEPDGRCATLGSEGLRTLLVQCQENTDGVQRVEQQENVHMGRDS
jgi:hypothetical protein